MSTRPNSYAILHKGLRRRGRARSDDLARSIAGCRRIANDPAQPPADRARAWHLLGNDDLATNALGDAIDAFGEAIKLDPNNAAIDHASRAIARLRKNDRAAAIFDYRRAASLDAARINGMLAASAELKDIADAAASAPKIGPTLTAIREAGCGAE